MSNTRALIKLITTAYEEDVMDDEDSNDILEDMLDVLRTEESRKSLNDCIPDLVMAVKKMTNKINDNDIKKEETSNKEQQQ